MEAFNFNSCSAPGSGAGGPVRSMGQPPVTIGMSHPASRWLIGTLKVKPTGALDKWKTQSCSVRGAKGVHDLYFKFIGGSGLLLNFDW